MVTIEWNPACVKVARADLARAGLGSRSTCEREAARTCCRSSGGSAVRSYFHRCRQAQHTALFRVGGKARAKRFALVVDNVVREGAILDRTAVTMCKGCAASLRLPLPTRASRGPRSRPLARRVMTGSPSLSSPPSLKRSGSALRHLRLCKQRRFRLLQLDRLRLVQLRVLQVERLHALDQNSGGDERGEPWSAGMTYQGACLVAVWRIVSS